MAEDQTLISDAKSTELAKRMFELRKEKDRIAAEENAINAELDQVREELTKIMVDLEMQNFAMDGMGTFYLGSRTFVNVTDDDRMIQWLDKAGREDIAPRKISDKALKEFIEDSLENDKPVPPTDLAELTTATSVRLRLSKDKKEK